MTCRQMYQTNDSRVSLPANHAIFFVNVPIEGHGRLLCLPRTRAAARQQSLQMPKANV